MVLQLKNKLNTHNFGLIIYFVQSCKNLLKKKYLLFSRTCNPISIVAFETIEIKTKHSNSFNGFLWTVEQSMS